MGWGLELWDKENEVKAHVEEGLKFIEKSRNFVLEMSKLEAAFGQQMKRLAKQYMPTTLDDAYSQDASYRTLLKTCEQLAEQHEHVATKLVDEVAEPMKSLLKDKEVARTQVYLDIARQNSAHDKERESLSKVQKKCDKAERESEAARQVFEKAERAEGGRAKAEKQKQAWTQKARQWEAIERELAQETEKYNRFRAAHYHVDMPALFDKLQNVNETRSATLVGLYGQMAKSYRSIFDNRAQLLETVNTAVSVHNQFDDSNKFAQRFTSKQPLPTDIPIKRRDQSDYQALSGNGTSSKTTDKNEPALASDDEDNADEPTTPQSPKGKGYKPTYRMLYAFPGTNPGELGVAAGEVVMLVENDGSGWVLCQKMEGQQGYVPQSYIEPAGSGDD